MVEQTLIAHPVLLECEPDFALYHLPTHTEHLYDIHRYVIYSEVTVRTNSKVNVLNLVEGDRIEILVDGKSFFFAYAETFVIPAAVRDYTIRNRSGTPAMVIKAFIK